MTIPNTRFVTTDQWFDQEGLVPLRLKKAPPEEFEEVDVDQLFAKANPNLPMCFPLRRAKREKRAI
jgi:hypothetical protein